jgi:hypothetical protein
MSQFSLPRVRGVRTMYLTMANTYELCGIRIRCSEETNMADIIAEKMKFDRKQI